MIIYAIIILHDLHDVGTALGYKPFKVLHPPGPVLFVLCV